MRKTSTAGGSGNRLTVSAAFLFILLLLYAYAFHLADRKDDLGSFESVLVQDMAQVARNTLHGDILQTKYVTPVGYAYLKRLENHPDYIRYPLPVFVYAALFAVFPDSPATIKILNAILFLLNAFLLARIFAAIFKDESLSARDEEAAVFVSWTAAVIASTAVLPYLRLALSDAYEMLTTTLLLLVVFELATRKRPVPTGFLCSLLYLSRPNMALMFVFAALFMMQDSKTTLSRLLKLGRFAAASIVVLLPFIARNLYYTGKPIFSIQQSLELAARSIPTHYAFYRSFSIPPSFVSFLPRLPDWFVPKLVSNLKLGFSFALHPAYWPAWLGLAFFIRRFNSMRRLVLLLLSFLVIHILAVSIYIQLFRIYIPIYFLLTAIGYLGLITFAEGRLRSLFDVTDSRRRTLLAMLPVIVVCAAVVTAGRSRIIPPVDLPAQLPSPQALAALQRHTVTCTYSNSPFWIPWYADIIAVYAPIDLFSIKSEGPPECRHYIYVEDPTRRLKPMDTRFLGRYGVIIERGENYILYELDLQR